MNFLIVVIIIIEHARQLSRINYWIIGVFIFPQFYFLIIILGVFPFLLCSLPTTSSLPLLSLSYDYYSDE